jgi:Secretion system C-terminal sorting domain
MPESSPTDSIYVTKENRARFSMSLSFSERSTRTPRLFWWLILALTVAATVQERASCQNLDPLNYFPHHLGDIWEYFDPYNPGYQQNRISRDSLTPDGQYSIEMTILGRFVFDTTASTVYQVGGFGQPFGVFPTFRLDADSGDAWIVFQDSVGRRSARVVDAYDTFLFGSETVTVKEIDYYDYAIGHAESLLTDTYYLAYQYGIIARDLDTFPVWRLRGCIIGGVLHGTVTTVAVVPDPQKHRRLQLRQNFPNPFNSSTTLEYYLEDDGQIEFELFDLLGRRVRIIESGYRSKGSSQVMLDARDLPSGIYVYQLRTSDQILSRKLALIR